ncbi:hypothetical protein SLA2020_452270 [Shorea laevis]
MAGLMISSFFAAALPPLVANREPKQHQLGPRRRTKQTRLNRGRIFTRALSSRSSSSLVFAKLRSSTALRVSFAVSPFSSRRGRLMAHTLAQDTLGLTLPASVEAPKVSFAAKEIDVTEWKGDILAVGVTEKDMTKDDNSKFENSILKKLDSQLGGYWLKPLPRRILPERLASQQFLGFGSWLKEAAAKTAQASDVAIVLASSEGLSAESKLNTATAIASGTVLGLYEDNRYKSESKKPALKSVDILGLGTGPELEKKLKYAEYVSSAVIFGRELVNSPANVLTPAVLAEEASKIASLYSDVLSATILDAEECKKLKMGSYLAVAAASANPPHFIHLCYKPPGGSAKVKLALVGKGLTFDSGGYNIKTGPGCSIELMKLDMGGSAAVLGAAKAIGQIKPPGVEVHFITIEVNNTDAEGRLTLADALVYACNQGVEKIVDLATLTGACVVALGPSIAGIFTPSDDLAKEVMAASEGGAITAALFLKQYVDEKVQWMHIDLAGPVWNEKKRTATGFGIATLVEWVLKNSS